jgi:hypothetical protein
MTIRHTLTATAAAAFVLAAGSASFAGKFVAMPAAGGGAQISCTVPNHVVCTVTSNKGLKSVKISANTPQGTIAVVDKTYRACPKQVQVAWDSAYQASNTQLVECASMGFKAAN